MYRTNPSTTKKICILKAYSLRFGFKIENKTRFFYTFNVAFLNRAARTR